MQENAFGFAHLLASGDAVSHAVVIVLAIMSIASWYLILAKSWDWWQMRRAARAVTAFWSASSVTEGIEHLRASSADSPYAQLASQASICNTDC
jgi:biopolymer transport protein ExbB